MDLSETELYEMTVERQGNRGVFSGIRTKKLRSVSALIALTLCRGSALFDADLHDRPIRSSHFQRIQSCSQQVEQRFRMCSLNFVMASAAFLFEDVSPVLPATSSRESGPQSSDRVAK